MRELDDKVVYALNMSLPTASIKARTESNPETNCKGLYETLAASYKSREKVIQDCIVLTAEQVSLLKKQRETSDNVQVEKKFKAEQRKVSFLNI
jgi:Caffeine-induced death protein 2